MHYRSSLKILWLVLCVALAACSSMKNQTDYPFQSEDGPAVLQVGEIGDECVLRLNGSIAHDLVRAFKIAAKDLARRKCASKWVLLDSIGGSVVASYQIGKIIRAKGFNTRLSRVGGVCLSSCGMLFISGVKREARDSRVIGAHLGFHQMYRSGKCVEPSDVTYTKLLNYASDLLSPEGAAFFVQLVTQTGCNSTQASISFQLLKEKGIITGENIAD
jgi:hypothetical protein